MLNTLTAKTPNHRCPSSMLRAAAAALVALTLALAVPAWSAIEISGPIATDTTLEAGATYHVTGSLTVAAGVTLTVPEGTVLKAAFGVAITVNGTLDVAGTGANPVYFTEERDGSVGEDVVVGDPGPGRWTGLIINDGGEAEIDHLRLRYAGASSSFPASIQVNSGGLLTLRDSIIAQGARRGLRIVDNSLAQQIEGNLIESHNDTGIELANTSGAIGLIDNEVRNNFRGLRLSNVSGDLQVENNQFVDNSEYGLYVSTVPRVGSLTSNTLTGNAAGPVFLEVNASASVVPLDNTLDGPVYVGGGTLTVEATWNDLHTYFLTSSLTVGAGVTWTLPPGVVVKLPFFQALGVSGQLIMSGTAGDPIHITDRRDASVGDYSDAGDPGPGSWTGLIINDGGVAEIDHLRLRYAGASSSFPASIQVNSGGLLTLRDSVIAQGARRGLRIVDNSLAQQIEGNLIESHNDTGIELANTSGAIGLIDNEVRNNFRGLRLSNVSGDLQVENNQFVDNSEYGLSVLTVPRVGTLSGNTLTGNAAGPVFLEVNASASVVPLDNTLDGPVYVGGGTLTVEATWNDLHTYFLTSSLTVGAGVTWALPPGVVVKLPFWNGLGVNGQLVVAGTADDPVHITDRRDASVGDYSDAGDPGPGSWIGLTIADGGVAEIDHLRLRYAGASSSSPASIQVNGGGLLTLRDSVIHQGSRAGVRFNGGSLAHQLERNLIETHGSSGIELINTSGAVSLIDNEVRNSFRGLWLSNASGEPQIENNQFVDNSEYGLYVSTVPRVGSLTSNTLTGNASGPVFLEVNASASVVPLDNTLDGPVYVGGGTLSVDATWNDLHTYFLTSSLTVGAGVTWALPPGVVVKLPFWNGLGVNGQLVVAGTADDPVHITDRRDASVGDYSDAGDPGPGSWIGLTIADGGVAEIDHLRLRYAGYSFSSPASIQVNSGGLLTLRDSVIHQGSRAGVRFNGGSLAHQLERNLIETHGSSGIELINTSGAVALIDNEVQLVSGPGINLNNVAAPVLVQGNRVLGGSGHGMLISSSGLPLPDEGEAPVIELIGNRIRAQAQDGMHIINSRVRIERNQLAENQGAGIRLSGESTSPDLFSNWVSGNAGGGIDIVDQANPLVGGTRENGNDIVGNAPFGLRSQNTQVTVLARCNWWGHPSGPSQDPENPDGQGDVILGPGSVDASPYLVESAIDALFLDRFEAQLLAQGDGC